ncbi:MAG TPA: lysylphosphatidylglycerol synthase transmembrane domain-containing protein [Thermoanaerobaculia bacterium]|nr:lysylphosphatidylglycerol synthase transmembrane domain-containing protein [Thermoanaerobaculia bacterium]
MQPQAVELSSEYAPVRGWRRTMGWILYTLGFGLLVALIVRTGPQRMWAALQESRWDLAALSVLAFCAGQACRGAKWAWLLRRIQPGVDPLLVVGCYFSNGFISYWTPARSGEALAPLLLASRCGTPKRLGLAVVLVDRVVDFAILVAAVAGAALYLGTHAEGSSAALRAGLFTGAALAAGAGFVFLAVLLATRSGLAARRGAQPAKGLTGLFWKLREAIAQVVRPHRLGVLGLMSVAAWLCDFASTYWIVNAVTPIGFLDSAAAQSVANGAALASFVPGGLGVSTASYVVVADLLGAAWQKVATAGVLAVVLNQIARFLLALAAGAHWARAAKRME